MNKKVSVLGAGSMGIAIGILLNQNSHNVCLWTPIKNEFELLTSVRQYESRLPGIVIPDDIEISYDLEYVMKDCEIIVLAVPSVYVRDTLKKVKPFIRGCEIVVSCVKGIEEDTYKLVSEVIEEELGEIKNAVISGPSYAIEIARNVPTTVVAASKNTEVARLVQDIFMSQFFRVYTSDDVVGVQIGGALKNVIALCAGIAEGLGYGFNTRAALITRGMTEISRLGVTMGGKLETFAGLSGIGDLILTCTGVHSRNRKAGFLIGAGKSLSDILDEIGMVVEGVNTVKPAYDLAKNKKISMPIICEAYEVLFNNKNPRDSVVELMTREKKDEWNLKVEI